MNNTTGADSASARSHFQAVLLRRDAMVLVLTWAASGVDAISGEKTELHQAYSVT